MAFSGDRSMEFAYKAINPEGKRVTGTLSAENTDDAMEKLASRDLIPESVAGKTGLSQGFNERVNRFLARVKLPDLILFTKQFRTLFNAGIPMSRLLEILEQQTENPKLKRTAGRMGQDIREGKSLAEAFRADNRIFPPLYTSMIEAGEASGRLGEVMDRLVYLLQHEHKVKSDVKGAMRYPVIVLVVLGIAFLFLLTFVVPQFVQIFEGAGIDLPLPTRISLMLHQWIVVYWFVCIGVLAVVLVALRFYLKTETGRYNKDYLLLKIPIIGPVLQKGAMSRFAAIFSILQASGITVLNAFDVLSATIGNKVIATEFVRIQGGLREGRGISGPLSSARFFTPMVVSMVAIGEESGNLDEMLSEISVHYDDEVEYAVSQMSEHIGPILIIALAAVVGFFALAIFMPMWDLVEMV